MRPADLVTLFRTNFTVCWVWTLGRIVIDPLIPARWLSPDRWPFRTMPWEGGQYYRRVWHIEARKGHLPTFTGGTRFPKRARTGSDPEYLNQFIVETCRGESNHVRAIGSVVIMKLWTPTALWVVMLAIAIAGNLPFIAIQRYNRPRLRRTLEIAGHRSMLRDAGGFQAESA